MENNRKIYSLLEISSGISQLIRRAFPDYYWVKAEIAKLNYYPKSGHCYPDLVEKHDGLVKAQMRANIWAGNFDKINRKFRQITGEPLKDGLKILFLAKVNYHEHYGLALNILDAEPTFTLGEMAREKQLTVERLKREGLFDENKKRTMPLLPKRIAVVSVETSKGYHDFKNILENNAWHYRFRLTLFPALLQGDGAVASINEQLGLIAKRKDEFDVVVIIRGGGGDVGLNAYDNYHLAKTVALFPLPVITGIGHSTNLTVVQMVAFANKITPTEAAHYLIQQFHNFSVRLDDAKEKIMHEAERMLNAAKQRFLQPARMFDVHTRNLLERHKMQMVYLTRNLEKTGQQLLDRETERLRHAVTSLQYHPAQKTKREKEKLDTFLKYTVFHARHVLEKAGAQIDFFESKTNLLKPENVLKKGYTISFVNGKVLRSAKEASPGQKMNTRLSDGEVNSIIE
jgi:exodeoxyribonuclease VII large subunit